MLRASTSFIAKSILLLFIHLLSYSSAIAESIEIAGVSIPVDNIQAIDEKNSRVELFGSVSLVPKDDIEVFVLSRYVDNKAGAIASDTWKRLTESALKQEATLVASKALQLAILSDLDQQGAGTEDFVTEILNSDDIAVVGISQQLAQSRFFPSFNEKIKVVVLSALGLENESWLRANLLKETLRLSDALQDYLEQRYVFQLQIKNPKKAAKIADFLASTFPSSVRFRKMAVLARLIGDFQGKRSTLSTADLLPLVSFRNSEPDLRNLVDPVLVDGFNAVAQSSIDRERYDDALLVLSSIHPDQRTPTTFALLEKCLKTIHPSSEVISGDSVRNLFISASQQNQLLRPKLLLAIEKRISFLLHSGRFNEAQATFADYLKINPDPSIDNDSIRMKFVLNFLDVGDFNSASTYRKQITFPLNLLDHLDLFFAGMYGNPYLYLLVVLVIILLIYGYSVLSRTFKSQAKKQGPVTAQAKTNKTEDYMQRPVFVTQRPTPQRDPLLEEYIECLRLFNLTEGADLKSIKLAYRNAVKEIHPDLNKNLSEEDSTRFVELTKSYDRIREIQKRLGL